MESLEAPLEKDLHLDPARREVPCQVVPVPAPRDLHLVALAAPLEVMRALAAEFPEVLEQREADRPILELTVAPLRILARTPPTLALIPATLALTLATLALTPARMAMLPLKIVVATNRP